MHRYTEKALCFFPVDNKEGSADPVMSHVKAAIQDAVKDEKYIQKKVPFAWLRVLERLNVEVGNGESAVKLDKVKTICNECGIETTGPNETVLVMLKY